MLILREILFLALTGALLFSDWKWGRLPYWLSYLGMVVAILGSRMLERPGEYEWSHAGLGIVAGYLISGLLAMIPGLMRDLSSRHPGREKLAGQDYAFIAMLGAFLGPLPIIVVFVLALVPARILAGMKLAAPLTLTLAALSLLCRYAGTPLMGHWFGL